MVRDPDDVQVLSPGEVRELREQASAANAGTDAGEDATDVATADTIPLAEQDPTERLFESFGDFNDCMDSNGQPFRGDPRENPELLEDTEYLEVIQKCAARSDILGALEAFQQFNEDLTPEEVEDRNQDFLDFSECLRARGWTVEAAPNAKGLLTPSVFESPDGDLDERDLRQCGSEVQD